MRGASLQVYFYTSWREREKERGREGKGEGEEAGMERERGGEQSLYRYLEPHYQHTFRHFQGSKHTCPRSIWDRIQSLVTDAFPVQDVLINDLYSCPPPPPPSARDRGTWRVHLLWVCRSPSPGTMWFL